LPLADEQFAREDLQPLTLKRYARGVAALTLMSVVVVNLVTIAAPVHLAGQRQHRARQPAHRGRTAAGPQLTAMQTRAERQKSATGVAQAW
jgi:hypothetical protein